MIWLSETNNYLASFLQCFYDQNLTKPLMLSEDGKNSIQINKTVEAGKTETFEVYIINRFEHEFHIENIDSIDEDLSVVPDVSVLFPNQIAKLKIVFAPKNDRFIGLDTVFTISGRFIIS